MARIEVTIEDRGGQFASFLREGRKAFRAELTHAIKQTAFAVGQRMKATAPLGPDAPHIKHDVEVEVRGMRGNVGYLTNPEQAAVALFNEYRPNKQPFMRAAAEDEANDFRVRATKALQRAARSLESGGGLT